MSGNNKKTGLFLCKCGTNIANFVDIDELNSWAKGKEELAFVKVHDLLCSPAGKKFVEDSIKETEASNVVIAACSPKMHEKTFRDTAAKVGLNLANVNMANIREQCGWVTKDKKEATEKSKKLINAVINRSKHLENLEARFMKCNTDVVVIGGGISGIEAALMAANGGRKVTIIEKNISLGGEIIKTEEVAPHMECAPCLLAPRLSAVKDHPNIQVVTNAEVTDVLGFFGNFTVKVKRKARYVESSCIGCEACFEVCPVSVKSDFHLGLGNRKAVYTAFPGSVPATAVIDKDNCRHFTDGSCDACVAACPFQSINFNDEEKNLEFAAGAVILATGFDTVEAKALKHLGYGSIDNVYTTPEFDRISSSNGPFSGNIQLKDGSKPKSIAVIHCAGSLSEKEGCVPYCSGICCMTALKVGEYLRKQNHDAVVYNIHDRLVFDGPEYHEFYHRQIEEGTKFLKTPNLSSVKVTKENGQISLNAEGIKPIKVDMVVLSVGMKPSKDAVKLANALNLDIDKNGYFKPDHSILHATGSSIDGIYIAGCAMSPAAASASITRGQAASGDALAKLIPGKEIELETMTCVISEEICSGCKLCITVCPYKAITFDKNKKISVINEAICRGCGTCAATCPSAGIKARHFTDKQIYAEIGGVIHE